MSVCRPQMHLFPALGGCFNLTLWSFSLPTTDVHASKHTSNTSQLPGHAIVLLQDDGGGQRGHTSKQLPHGGGCRHATFFDGSPPSAQPCVQHPGCAAQQPGPALSTRALSFQFSARKHGGRSPTVTGQPDDDDDNRGATTCGFLLTHRCSWLSRCSELLRLRRQPWQQFAHGGCHADGIAYLAAPRRYS